MRDVSCTTTASALEVLERMGVPPEDVVSGLPVDLARLRSPSKTIDWDTFAAFMDKVGERIGPDGLQRMGAMLFDAPSFRYVSFLAGMLVTPRQVLRITERLLGPALFPLLHRQLEELPDGRLRLTLEVPPGHRVSEAFFLSVAGNLQAIPRIFDLPDARMELMMEGRRAAFTLGLPEERWLDRVRRTVRAVRHPRSVVTSLVERRKALQSSYDALARFRQDFQTVIERLPDGVAVLRGGKVLYANRAVIEGLGYERLDEVAQRPVTDFLPREEQERLARSLVRSEGRPPAGEVALRRRDDRQVVFEILPVQVIDFEGEPANLVVVRDVTDRKRLQQQLMLADRMASLGTLAAGVAHEVNNPLAYAHISLHTLARHLNELKVGEAAGAQRLGAMKEALAAAQHGVDRVRTIVGDLRTFSRPDDESVVPVDVHRVLESAISMAAQELRHRARLVRDYDEVPRVLANDARLGQVFLNLLVNAAQAMREERRSRNVIRLQTHAEPNGNVTVEVIDNGPGIPPEILEHVFAPFVTTKPSGVGTGLGLSICHRIVTRLGGQIGVESAPDRGTTVRVTLPPAEAVPESSSDSSSDRSLAPAEGTGPRGRVLVVDDEPVLLRTLESLLAPRHEVVTAGSGRSALELLTEDGDFDLILCDLMMNGVTGMDVYEKLKRSRPGLERRIVFMTGGAFTSTTRRFLAQVDNPCLDKPFAVEDVLDLVRRQLASAGAVRADRV
ncbi:MAG: hybrid sensor histidine kinase/response regulator [Myxococcota bacterium]